MSLEESILSRRSVRKYQQGSIDIQELVQLLDKARWAPSACNKQEYYFIIVDDKRLLTEIVEEGGAKTLLQADKVVFVLYCALTDNFEYADNIQSASATVQNFLLLAYEKGIGTCWICHLPRKRTLARLLNIPNGIEVVAAISLGHANFDSLHPVERKFKIDDIVGLNTFYSRKPVTLNKGKILIKRIANRFYYRFPRLLKKYIDKTVEKRFVKKFYN